MNMLESVISIFAPHNCISCGSEGALVCHDCWPGLGNPIRDICHHCKRSTDGYAACASCSKDSSLNNVYVRAEYKRVAKELIQRLKFERAKAAANIVAKAMSEMLVEQLPNNYSPIVVPIPTASSRRRQRGYDQAVLIARAIASEMRLDYSPLMVRIGQSRQVGTDREDRLRQMDGSYRVRSLERVKDRPILLVDDVLTTGATLEAAAKALRSKGIKVVDAAVFAAA